jgi:hypothetical protein
LLRKKDWSKKRLNVLRKNSVSKQKKLLDLLKKSDWKWKRQSMHWPKQKQRLKTRRE